jgi:arylsulfatase A-like enzyme
MKWKHNGIQGENMTKKKVIVIMVDSLRFNYLGCYGNEMKSKVCGSTQSIVYA